MKLLIEQIITEGAELVDLISIVDEPAILTGFVKLKKEDDLIKLAVDRDKQIVTGPALIPNVKIYRSAESLGMETDGYIFFKEETIRTIADNYLLTERNNNVNLDHSEDTKGAHLIESWIIEDSEKDKSSLYGFELPVGTWMCSMKITDDDLWKKIKDGEYNGFSIEGQFGAKVVGQTNMSIESKKEEISDDMKAYLIGAAILKDRGEI